MPEVVEPVVEDPRWEAAGIVAVAERAARAALVAVARDPELHEIGLLACDDARIAVLNADFRGKAVPTNVLSWPAFDGPVPEEPPGLPGEGPLFIGDIALGYETCAREAAEAGIPLADHAAHLVVHGTLHLLGHRPRRGRRGGGDGGDRDEGPCQHGHRGPIFARGAPLGRGVRTGVMGEQNDGPAASAPRAPDEDPDSSGRSFFSRLFRREAPADEDEGAPDAAPRRQPVARATCG